MANDSAVYDTDWLSAAIPADPKLHGRSANCLRYGSVNASTTINGLKTGNQCSANMFNRSQTIKCHDFVFKSNERRLLQQVYELLISVFFAPFICIDAIRYSDVILISNVTFVFFFFPVQSVLRRE